MTQTITLEGSDESIRAEVHDGELFLSILSASGPLQRVHGMEAAVGRIFPNHSLIRRTRMAARLLESIAAGMGGGRL